MLENIVENITNCTSLKDLLEKLDLKYDYRNIKKVNDILSENNIDKSHFNRKSKYFLIKKTCKCGIEFETYNGGKFSKKCCGISCSHSREWSEDDNLKKSKALKNKHTKYNLIQKQCVRCSKMFETVDGGSKSKKLCSINCANTKVYTEDEKKLISKNISEGLKNSIKFGKYTDNKLNEYHSEETIKERLLNIKNNILNADFNTLSFTRLRMRVLYEQDEKCNKCGLNEWMGEPLTLELEHKDGNNKNNLRDNLECLCPNCHSLTPTWRGKNKNKQRLLVSDEVLLTALVVENFNVRQALIKVGLTPKGNNYIRCHRLKKEYDNLS